MGSHTACHLSRDTSRIYPERLRISNQFFAPRDDDKPARDSELSTDGRRNGD